MRPAFLFSILLSLLLFSCDMESLKQMKLNSVEGFAEKGPFASGSDISLFELKKDLSKTDRVFETKTDSRCKFVIETSTNFISKYVKLSVSGLYFNEVTGDISDMPITLEALGDISKTHYAKLNVNILTHLITPRIEKLMSEGLLFYNARFQAVQELLNAFRIYDVSLKPEQVSITDNNEAANVLIAINSILLNERDDSQFIQLVNDIREDLVDGVVSNTVKRQIQESNHDIDAEKIKINLINYYQQLGYTIKVGNFEEFLNKD